MTRYLNTTNKCSLNESPVKEVLDQLYIDSYNDIKHFAKAGAEVLKDKIFFRKPSQEIQSERMRELSLPISESQGIFLYNTVRSIKAKIVVEFGTSFGISTIHLAAALKDSGGGKIITSEIDPYKAGKAEENISAAGLSEYVEIREGDALETLKGFDGVDIDLLFIDGWKESYLDLLKMLAPQIKQGGVVLSDNVIKFKKYLELYVSYLQDPENGFSSVTLPIGDGLEYSVKL